MAPSGGTAGAYQCTLYGVVLAGDKHAHTSACKVIATLWWCNSEIPKNTIGLPQVVKFEADLLKTRQGVCTLPNLVT